MRCPQCDTPVLGSETVCMYCHRRLDYDQLRQAEDTARAARDPQLRRIRSPYDLEIVVALLGLPVTLLLLIVGLWLGWNPSFSLLLPLALGASLLLTLVLAAALKSAARGAIELIPTSEQTLHWTYNKAEWQQFTSQAWRRAIRRDLLIGGVLLVLLVVIGLIILGSGVRDSAAPTEFAIVIGVAGGMGLLFCLKDGAIWLIRRRRRSSEAYISPAGIIVGGWYSPLGGLDQVVYQPGNPAVLRFVVRSRMVDAAGRHPRRRREIEVPIPQGREAEAEHLVAILKHEGF